MVYFLNPCSRLGDDDDGNELMRCRYQVREAARKLEPSLNQCFLPLLMMIGAKNACWLQSLGSLPPLQAKNRSGQAQILFMQRIYEAQNF